MIDDATAEEFSRYMEKYPELYRQLAEVVQQHIHSKKTVVVDLGVGPGLLSKEILHINTHATIIGVDPHKKMLELAKKNIDSSMFHAKQGTSEHIPVEDGSVDVLVSRFSLTYWENPSKSFSEISRVLKKDGVVILEVINRDFPKWRLLLIKLHMSLNRAGAAVTKYHIDVYKDAYTIEQVSRFLANAGFSILEKKGRKKEWKFIIVGKK